ncbi:MAG: type IX secretion system sortase PorU [Tannerellaceae bacterium]|nr:type IX secretion system sortase PorU [Tannerellaceae bacterium]
MNVRKTVATVALAALLFVPVPTKADTYASHSRLAEGKWVKIETKQTGIYKIKYSELKDMGFADPAKVSVHGYGGWPLEEDFSLPFIDDLPATAVYRGSDFILFYGRGTVKWTYNPSTLSFTHTNNPYSTAGYYFLTDATDGKEMRRETLATLPNAASVTVYDEYRVHEEDLVSVNESGRELYGESFAGGGSKTLTDAALNISGITDDTARITMRFIARPRNTSGAAYLSVDGQRLLTLNFRSVSAGNDDYYVKAIASEGMAEWLGSKKEKPQIEIAYSKSGDENVFLDYVRLHAKRTLGRYGDYTFFRSVASINRASRFVVKNTDENTVILDVTDPLAPFVMETSFSSGERSFTIPAGSLREFAVVQTNAALGGWTKIGEIKNQDLHGTAPVDMVIISADAFTSQAERLARRHGNDGLRVLVVTPGQIYNEFSSGASDATAYRRFMKMLYDRAADLDSRPKYLLLFGDGSYDNRFLTAEWKKVEKENMLLTYQSVNSLNQYSYVTDDYFGFLSSTSFNYGPLQLGTGRFPVRTVAEATVAVDKVIAYMDNKVSGDWKNRIAFVADDGNSVDRYSTMHADSANRLADYVRALHPEFMISKLFFDAYKKIGSTYPDIRDGIKKQLRDGLLIINYSGHGDTEKWSDESVLTAQDISEFSHDRLPLWITATCDFTRFDHPQTTAGENVFLQKSGGIAMLTTTRVVYAQENSELNTRLFTELFKRDGKGKLPALGDAVRLAKSAFSNTNKFNFILIGDPAMHLSVPENIARVTKINNHPAGAGNDAIAFKALEEIKVEGEILTSDSSLASSFNGTLHATVFDSRQIRRTLDNNRTGETFDFTDYPNRLFVGSDAVKDGKFAFSFTVPKDMSYSGDFGLMSLYALSETTNMEAAGSFSEFTVGGSGDVGSGTDVPEIVQLYLNDSTFVEGGVVNPTPLFVARVRDKKGLNISGSGIGHDIILSIDNKPALTYTLNTYCRLLPGAEGEGIVQFPIPSLAKGKHVAEFKVWNVLNNPASRSFSFEVSDELKPVISNVIASPVPARDNLQFRIYHNMPESELTVDLRVYDLNGRQQWQSSRSVVSPAEQSVITVDWDLCGSSGSRLRPGIYIYRASLRTSNSEETTKANKMVILAQ